MKTSRLPLLLLLALLQEHTAFLFQQQQRQRAVPTATTTKNRRGRRTVTLSPSYNKIQSRGGGGGASVTIADSAAHDDATTDENIGLQVSAQDAVQSVKSCIQMTFLSALADSVTFVPSLLLVVSSLAPAALTTNDDSLLTCLEVTFTAWKVYFAVQLKHVNQRVAPDGGKSLSKQIESSPEFIQTADLYFTKMGNLWRSSTAVVAVVSLAELYILSRSSSSSRDALLLILLAIPAVFGMCVTWTLRQTNDHLPLLQPSMDDDEKQTALVGNARRMIRNMGLCVGAILLRACVIPIRAWYMDGGSVKKVNELTSFPTPLGLAVLLLQLRWALWAVATEMQGRVDDVRQRVSTTSKQALFGAQVAFWSHLASVFKTEAIVKVLVFVGTQIILPLWKK